MNAERLFKIVLMELTNDQLKLEEELEVTINSDIDINTKVITIKSLLTKISANDASIKKFSSMAEIINKNNNSN